MVSVLFVLFGLRECVCINSVVTIRSFIIINNYCGDLVVLLM